jgi:hypothetical protein
MASPQSKKVTKNIKITYNLGYLSYYTLKKILKQDYDDWLRINGEEVPPE